MLNLFPRQKGCFTHSRNAKGTMRACYCKFLNASINGACWAILRKAFLNEGGNAYPKKLRKHGSEEGTTLARRTSTTNRVVRLPSPRVLQFFPRYATPILTSPNNDFNEKCKTVMSVRSKMPEFVVICLLLELLTESVLFYAEFHYAYSMYNIRCTILEHGPCIVKLWQQYVMSSWASCTAILMAIPSERQCLRTLTGCSPQCRLATYEIKEAPLLKSIYRVLREIHSMPSSEAVQATYTYKVYAPVLVAV